MKVGLRSTEGEKYDRYYDVDERPNDGEECPAGSTKKSRSWSTKKCFCFRRFATSSDMDKIIWYVILFIIILKGFDPIFLLSCFYYISITYSLVLRNCFISFNFVCTVYFFLFFLNFPRHKSTYFCNKNKYGKADHFVSPEL